MRTSSLLVPSVNDCFSTFGLRSPKSLRKVFVIGLNKTDTTSLGDALHTLGYRRSS